MLRTCCGYFLLIQLFLSSIAQGQMAHLEKTNSVYLLNKSAEWRDQAQNEYNKAIQLAAQRNWPTTLQLEDGTIASLIRIVNDKPQYLTTTNLNAAQVLNTHQLWQGGGLGLDLEGENMIIGEWDGGEVRQTHQEFGNRVQLMDAPSPNGMSSHATHVAGTLIASGVDPSARGMAPKANLRSYDWYSDQSEMAAEAAGGLLVSNHSYGYLTGWASGKWYDPNGPNQMHWWGDPDIDSETDWKFGFYDGIARNWDDIAYNAPYYLIVKSAGNDRNDNGSGDHYVRDSNGDWVLSSDFRNPDGDYDCLPLNSNAKNILTIGAVSSGGSMSSFSGWGPTDDGRIKPDVVGKGVGLYSSIALNDNAYGSSSGTSMSGPNVAGSLLLLQEYAIAQFGEYIRASTLKGLTIHTASPLTTGPSYSFGWGMVNTAAAANFITGSTTSTLLETSISNGEVLDYDYHYDGLQDLKVTICWTDPPGVPHSAALDNPTIKLIHDLDIRLIDNVNNTIYFPFILDPNNPSAEASTGDNIRDNVEMISIERGILPAGDYLVEVSHKGTLSANQEFSLFVSGMGDITQLSVNFISANANYQEKQGIIDWSIANVETIDKFEIERSTNSFYEFDLISTIYDINDKNTIYSFTDDQLPLHEEIYYRIKAISKQNEMFYSPILRLKTPQYQQDISIYPNPGSNAFHLRTSRPINTIEVFDMHGKVYKHIANPDAVSNDPYIYSFHNLSIPSGVYTIRAINKDDSINHTKWINK